MATLIDNACRCPVTKAGSSETGHLGDCSKNPSASKVAGDCASSGQKLAEINSRFRLGQH
jgi:hypothetical protein